MVEAALAGGEREAAHSLAPLEAGWLVGGLRLRGRLTGDGRVCFSRYDFAAFGHILATVLSTHADQGKDGDRAPLPSSVRQLSIQSHHRRNRLSTSGRQFTRPAQGDLQPARAARCECSCSDSGTEPWCGDSRPKCCARYCSSIFQAIAVGALAALFEDGVHACCRDASRSCEAPVPRGLRVTAASRSPLPKFRFRAPPPTMAPAPPTEPPPPPPMPTVSPMPAEPALSETPQAQSAKLSALLSNMNAKRPSVSASVSASPSPALGGSVKDAQDVLFRSLRPSSSAGTATSIPSPSLTVGIRR